MVVYALYRAMSLSCMYLYPAFASFKVASHQPASTDDLRRWLRYWSVLSIIIVFDCLFEDWRSTWYGTPSQTGTNSDHRDRNVPLVLHPPVLSLPDTGTSTISSTTGPIPDREPPPHDETPCDPVPGTPVFHSGEMGIEPLESHSSSTVEEELVLDRCIEHSEPDLPATSDCSTPELKPELKPEPERELEPEPEPEPEPQPQPRLQSEPELEPQPPQIHNDTVTPRAGHQDKPSSNDDRTRDTRRRSKIPQGAQSRYGVPVKGGPTAAFREATARYAKFEPLEHSIHHVESQPNKAQRRLIFSSLHQV